MAVARRVQNCVIFMLLTKKFKNKRKKAFSEIKIQPDNQMEALRTHRAVNILKPLCKTLLILWQKWRNIFSLPTQLQHIPEKNLSMPQSIGFRMWVAPLVLWCHIWTALKINSKHLNCPYVMAHIYLETSWKKHHYASKILHNQKLNKVE